MTENTTLRDAIARATARLELAGVPSPASDARTLSAFALGIEPKELATRLLLGETMPGAARDRLDELIGERESRVPLQHLTGSAAFRYLEVAVGPGVFIPRPETEVLVDEALSLDLEAPLVVDLCSGSAAMTISLAVEVPGSRVWGIEKSVAAHAWSLRNADTHAGLIASSGSHLSLVLGDATQPLELLPELAGRVDLVVANPPYIPPGAVPGEPEVARHDPALALYGRGPDGLAIPRAITGAAAQLLRPGGWFICEHAQDQGARMRAILSASGRFEQVRTRPDHTRRDRMTIGQRTAQGRHEQNI